MSRAYYTGTDFHVNQAKVRQIVQNELEQFFNDMKVEIEGKINQIDRTLLELKDSIATLERQINKKGTSGTLEQRVEELYAQIEEVRKYKQAEIEKLMEEIRNRSMDRSDRSRERSPLFRRNMAPSLDLNSVLFGGETQKPKLSKNSETVVMQSKKQPQSRGPPVHKPPLPKPKAQPKIYEPKLSEPRLLQQPMAIPVVPPNADREELPSTYGREQQHQNSISSRLAENLNKNKNSFMRKKSLKKIGVIAEQQNQQSMLSNN